MAEPPELSAVVAAMLAALELERDELRARLGPLGRRDWVPVARGRRVQAEPGAYAYELECTLDAPIPEGTAVRLAAGGEVGTGEVLRFDREEEQLLLLLKQDLGAELAEGAVSFDPSSLLLLIGARLRLIAEAEAQGFEPPFSPRLALALLAGDAPARPRVAAGDLAGSAAQRAAVEHALGQEVAYLWGPPGTGKTRTLALLVHELVRRGEQVLLVAHTNVAADTALRRVLEVGAVAAGTALRLGPVGEALAGLEVGLDQAVDRAARARHPELVAAITALGVAAAGRAAGRAALLTAPELPLPRRLRLAATVLEQVEDDSDDPAGLAPALAEASVRLQALELEVLARARVVATTLTRATISGLCKTLRPATVIIDEASTAPLPTAFAAAALATRRVVAVGDFLQLSPIAASPAPAARRWLARNLFSAAGCGEVDADHPLRALLDEQWRMHPQIAAVVSRTFYAGRLRDARPRATDGPAIALYDTAGTGAVSVATAGGSKQNPAHAALVTELALAAARTREVAIITPYRAQVRRIRELIRARARGWLEDGRIEVFSVHRFQGRERSLVLFDTVEAPGTAPRFLDDLHNPDAARLVNVAISRAVDRLVLVFHGDQLAALGRASSIGRVLAAARTAGARELDAADPADRDRARALVGAA